MKEFKSYKEFLTYRDKKLIISAEVCDELVVIFNSQLFKEEKVKVFETTLKDKTIVFVRCCNTCCESRKRLVENAPKNVYMRGVYLLQEINAYLPEHDMLKNHNDIENIHCQICKSKADDDLLLACDGECGKSYHTYCLKPALDEVPEGEWFCPVCSVDVVDEENDDKKKLKRLIEDILDEKLSEIQSRLYSLERISNSKRQKVDFTRCGGGNGECSSCGMKNRIDDNTKRLLPHLLPFRVLKMNGIREIDGDKVIKEHINKNKICKSCKKNIFKKDVKKELCHNYFDTANKFLVCMLCRTSRSNKSSTVCGNCKVDGFQSDHATCKLPLHNTIKVIEHSLENVKHLETSYDMDKSASIYHEFDVGEYGKIDFLTKVTDIKDRVIMFAIEVLATKTEDMKLYPHKMFEASRLVKPFKSIYITLDINDRSNNYTVVEKLVILRRWIMFAVRYIDYLPSHSLWWMFSNNRNPYVLKEEHHPFFHNPVKIDQSVSGNVGWEFDTDPFIYTKNDTNMFNKINSSSEHFNIKLFGGNFEEGNYSKYIGYNIDKEMLYPKLHCKVGCEICKKINV